MRLEKLHKLWVINNISLKTILWFPIFLYEI